MKTEKRQVGFINVVSMEGRLDSSSSGALETSLLQSVQEGSKHLLLDFGRVEFMASSGIRMLLGLRRNIEDVEGRLVLASLPASVKDVLEVTGALPHFEVCETVDLGIARMTDGRTQKR